MGLLEEVGLSHRADHRPGKFPEGRDNERRWLAPSINQPELLLADEPTGALDKKIPKLVDLLASLNEKHGLTLLMVTHSEVSASRMKRSYTLDEGRLNELVQMSLLVFSFGILPIIAGSTLGLP